MEQSSGERHVGGRQAPLQLVPPRERTLQDVPSLRFILGAAYKKEQPPHRAFRHRPTTDRETFTSAPPRRFPPRPWLQGRVGWMVEGLQGLQKWEKGLTYISFRVKPVSALWLVPPAVAPHLHFFTSMGSPHCRLDKWGGSEQEGLEAQQGAGGDLTKAEDTQGVSIPSWTLAFYMG